MSNKAIPVTLVTGFLESGKTTAVKKILERGFGDFSGNTILIDCEEEGGETYDGGLLASRKVTLIDLDGPFLINADYLKSLDESLHPSQVFIEYGGMFKVSYLDGIALPEGWSIVRQLTVFDGGVFDIYLKNLKDNIADMVKYSNLILFNRCADTPGKGTENDRIRWAALLHKMNPKAEIVFEGEDGRMI
ncbi:MAG TPA: GTP-binding protein [Lachnospiraceae bacterium]|nr:GTP-binding protein [Lachnospiraceae bacterium]